MPRIASGLNTAPPLASAGGCSVASAGLTAAMSRIASAGVSLVALLLLTETFKRPLDARA